MEDKLPEKIIKLSI